MGVEYIDDRSIPDEARLWRRIPPRHFIFDENLGGFRPSKAAFADHPDGSPMSVILADVLLEAGRTPESALTGNMEYGLAEFSAGLVRSLNQGVVRKPLPEELAHSEVFGKKNGLSEKNHPEEIDLDYSTTSEAR